MGRNSDAFHSVKDRTNGADVVLKGAEDRRRAAKDVDALRCGDGK